MTKIEAMADEIINSLTSSSVENGVIEKSEISIYQYGLKHLMLIPIYFLSYILIGIVTNNLLGLLLYLILFTAIRVFAGGFHMKSRYTCFVTTMGIVGITSLILKEYQNFIHIPGWIIVIGVSYAVIMRLAPVDNEKRIFDESEKQFFRKITVIIVHIEAVLFGFFLIRNMYFVSFAILLAFIQEAILLWLGSIMKRRHLLF